MSVWTGKACARCGNKKGKKFADLKYCGHCQYKVKKEKSRNAHGRAIESRYGITQKDYDDLYAFQGGVCYICRRATGRTRRLTVDHDHKTGMVRGLLCRPCNTILGHARDMIEFFERCISYLKDPPYSRMLRGEKDDTLEH